MASKFEILDKDPEKNVFNTSGILLLHIINRELASRGTDTIEARVLLREVLWGKVLDVGRGFSIDPDRDGREISSGFESTLDALSRTGYIKIEYRGNRAEMRKILDDLKGFVRGYEFDTVDLDFSTTSPFAKLKREFEEKIESGIDEAKKIDPYKDFFIVLLPDGKEVFERTRLPEETQAKLVAHYLRG